MTVVELRAQLRARRRAIPDTDAARAAERVRDLALAALDPRREARDRAIGSYLAHDGELDAEPLAATWREQGGVTCYPVVAPGEPEPLSFRAWDGVQQLEPGSFGILAPPEGEVVPPQDLWLVLVPLVGFDRDRHRLGMGAGYYDRTFGPQAIAAGSSRPTLVGLAHDLQEIEAIEAQPWDVTLDMIVTPTRVLA